MRIGMLLGLVVIVGCGSRPARPKGPPPEYEEPVPTANATPTPTSTSTQTATPH